MVGVTTFNITSRSVFVCISRSLYVGISTYVKYTKCEIYGSNAVKNKNKKERIKLNYVSKILN